MTHYLFALPALMVSIALTGCEVAPQDSSGVDSRQSLNGLAVDGRVAGGMRATIGFVLGLWKKSSAPNCTVEKGI